MTTSPTRFPIRFEPWYALLSSALLLRPSESYVDVTDGDVSARMGWAFSARFPRASVIAIKRLETKPLSRGVHGLAGRWLVNGSGSGVVVLELSPTAEARVLGFPVRLDQLLVSVEDPDALIDRVRLARRG